LTINLFEGFKFQVSGFKKPGTRSFSPSEIFF
jgi:hypothetical protein